MEQFDDFSAFSYDYVLEGTYIGVFHPEQAVETDESTPTEEEINMGETSFEEEFIEWKEEEIFEETIDESEEQYEREENEPIEEVKNTKKKKTLVGRMMEKLLAMK